MSYGREKPQNLIQNHYHFNYDELSESSNLKNSKKECTNHLKKLFLLLKIIVLSILFLFIPSTISAKQSEEFINFEEISENLSEFVMGEEVTLMTGKGPFEVSGKPSSFAVVWVDEGENEKDVLMLAIFEEMRIPYMERISDDIDSDERIFLKKIDSQIIILWKSINGWNLYLLKESEPISTGNTEAKALEEEPGIFKKDFVKLITEGNPLAISTEENKLFILMVPGKREIKNKEKRENNEKGKNTAKIEKIERLDLPHIIQPTLFEIDLINSDIRMLYQFPMQLSYAALSNRDNYCTALVTEFDTRNLQYLEIDSSGRLVDFYRMNNFTVRETSTILKELKEKSIAGWIENRPLKNMAILGLLMRGESGNYYSTKEISHPEGNVADFMLSEGKGLWTVWNEVIGDNNWLRMMAMNLDGNPVCLLESDLAEKIKKFWVMEDSRRALLLTQKNSSPRKSFLTIQEIECHGLEEERNEIFSSEEPSFLENQTDSLLGESIIADQGSPLGGAEDPCDGYDNDNDGTIDNGCDQSCEDPEKLGSDIRITYYWSRSPSLVWTGSEYGVSWVDSRDGNTEIYFVRLNSSGGKIGSDVRVTFADRKSSSPSLVWTGAQYGIAWQDRRHTDQVYYDDIYFVELDSAGNKIGDDKRIAHVHERTSEHPSLTWTRSEYGLAWEDNRDSAHHDPPEIYFVRLDSSGNKIGSDIRITMGGNETNPSLVWAGDKYGLAWESNNGVNFIRLNSSGNPIGSPISVTDYLGSHEQSLVWTGSQYGISYTDSRDGNWGEIYFTRLDSSGTKIGSDIRVTYDSDNSNGSSLVWNGSEYGLSWADNRDLGAPDPAETYFARLDSSGNKIGTELRVTYDDAESLSSSLVWAGDVYGVSWHDERNTREIFFASIRCCDDEDSDGYSECTEESNDADPGINPDAAEICDGIDNDSDGSLDEPCDSACDSPEKLGSDHRVTSDAESSLDPSLIWVESGYGIAWHDYRDGNAEIYFAKLDSSGNQISSDIRITYATDASMSPSMAWTGNEYGISWRDVRDGNYEIYFARLDTSGSKIGSDIRVTGNAGNSISPSLAWNGSGYGVCWHDYRNTNWEIYFTRLDSLGNKLGIDIRITSDPSSSVYPSLAWTGNGYGVSWHDDRDDNDGDGTVEHEIYFARLDYFGNKIDLNERITSDSSDSINPSLIWTGSEYAVSWEDNRDGNDEIYFARLDSSGFKIDPPGDVRLTSNSSDSNNPFLFWTGSEFGVSWEDNRNGNYEIYFATIDPSGSKVGSDIRITEDGLESKSSVLTWSGSEYGITWYDDRDGNHEIYFSNMRCCDDMDGDSYTECFGDSNDADPEINFDAAEVCDGKDNNSDSNIDEGCDTSCDSPAKWGSEERITNDTSFSLIPSIIWTGNEYGLSWYDLREGNYEIYFVRIDSSGNKIGSDERISFDDSSSNRPSLAWIGNEYGVSWSDSRDGNAEIYFARLDSVGSKIGSDMRVTYSTLTSSRPSLVWALSEYGVSWYDDRDGNDEIYFTRLDSSGNKIGSDIRLSHNSSYSQSPSLAWSGSEYGVSYHDNQEGNYEIYFARLDVLGNKIGSEVRVTHYENHSYDPSLVWTGSRYGISWHDNQDGNYEIYFAQLDSSGSKIGSDLRVTEDSAESRYASLAWTGGEYGISWNDSREGNTEIYFARVDSSGAKIGAEIRITEDYSNSTHSSMVWTGSEYGISWYDNRSGNEEIHFVLTKCCGNNNDGDGYGACDDCDDQDDSVYPGASPVCDGKNNDCDDTNWPGLEGTEEYDDDGDSYSECSGDCNDADPEISPGKVEIICNGIDEDCDGTEDDGPDNDGDSYDACGIGDIVNPDGLERDCNDFNSSISPGGIEVCNGYDDDCDDSFDEGCDSVCDNTMKEGSDGRITDDSSISSDPSLIWSGSEYGTVWEDYRDGNYEIYFARLDSSGTKIGSDVRVTDDSSVSSNPSLVWTGSEYGAVWEDNRDGNYEIYFARLDSSGAKIGSDVRVIDDSSFSVDPSLVWSGSEYGVAWEDNRDGNYEIYFTRLDSAGAKIGSDVRVTDDSSVSSDPSLVWSGSEYGVAWEDNRDGNYEIYFARLGSSGSKIGADVRVTSDSSHSYDPSLIWTGTEYGVSWHDIRDGNSEIYFSRLDSLGGKIGLDVRVTEESSNSQYAFLQWTGDEYGISWDDYRNGNREIYFARLDSAGNKLDDDLRITDNSSVSASSSLVWAGTEYAVVWKDNRDGNYEIYFVLLQCCDDVDGDGYSECAGDSNDADPDINPEATEICDGKDNDGDGSFDEVCDTSCDEHQEWGSEAKIADGAAHAKPSLVWTGDEYGVSWNSNPEGNHEIYFAMFDAYGTKIDPPGDVRITYDPENSGSSSLVWTGSEYAVSWHDDRDGNNEIYFSRIDATGTKIGSDIRITYEETYSQYPSLVWTGSEYGVSWEDERDRDSYREIYFARLDASGSKLGSDVRVTHDQEFSGRPSLVWAGSEYGVSWYDTRDVSHEIYFVKIDPSGNKIGPDIRVTYTSGNSQEPALSWTGSEYGISWRDSRNGLPNYEIYFVRLDTSGNKVGSDMRVSSDDYESNPPSLSWTGSEFGVAWSNVIHDFLGDPEIYFARLDSSGNKIGSELMITESDFLDSDFPSLVWNGTEFGLSWGQDGPDVSGIRYTLLACCGNVFDIPVVNLLFESNKQIMNWHAEARADSYDIVKGALETLLSGGGDFTTSLTGCLEDDSLDTQASDTAEPTSPGEGFYYLVRSYVDCREGTYDTMHKSQTGDRDAEVDASANKCP